MANGIFVTGTDTGAGKTYFCSLLVKKLRQSGVDAVGIKPFCCGDREDAERLREACDRTVEIGLINPVWLRVPAAPYAAALVESRALDVASALSAFETLRARHRFVVVEGVGGWRVPLTENLCLSDFARQLALPVLVVTANRLGALNHTQLTVDAIKASGPDCLGVVLNQPSALEPCPAQITNPGILEHLLDVPVLGEIDHGAEALPENVFQNLLGQNALKLLLPA
jgi:dethiobiotin synthetase